MIIAKMIEKKRREIKRAKKRKKIIEAVKYTAAGCAVGITLGIFFAPRSGKQTISKIKENISSIGNSIEGKSKDIITKTENSLLDKKSKIIESKKRIKEYFNKNANLIEIKSNFYDKKNDNDLEI